MSESEDRKVSEIDVDLNDESVSNLKHILRNKLGAELMDCSLVEYDEAMNDIKTADDLPLLESIIGRALINDVLVSAIKAKMDEESEVEADK